MNQEVLLTQRLALECTCCKQFIEPSPLSEGLRIKPFELRPIALFKLDLCPKCGTDIPEGDKRSEEYVVRHLRSLGGP